MNMRLAVDPRHRWQRLTIGVLAAWILLFIPMVAMPRGQEPVALALAQGVICGVILGMGRQGIDVLLIRLFGASTAIVLSSFYSGLFERHGQLCAGPQDCAQLIVFGLLVFGTYGTTALALVALPTTMLWNRGVGTLRPEVRWPLPRTWWHWLLVVLGLLIGIPILGVLIGIPWPG